MSTSIRATSDSSTSKSNTGSEFRLIVHNQYVLGAGYSHTEHPALTQSIHPTEAEPCPTRLNARWWPSLEVLS